MADDWNSKIISEFRANAGKVGGSFEGAPLLLLHSTGAKSGADRVSPLMFRSDEAGIAIFASAAGSDKNPDWYHNLLESPEAKIEIGTQTLAVRARVAESDERDVIWTAQKQEYPGFAGYEAKTRRVIPVMILEVQP